MQEADAAALWKMISMDTDLLQRQQVICAPLSTYSLTYLLTYSVPQLLDYSLLLTHLLTYSLTHLLTYLVPQLLDYSLLLGIYRPPSDLSPQQKAALLQKLTREGRGCAFISRDR